MEQEMDISYEYYRVFYYVAQCGNITQAAKTLTSNQPNVTRVIKTLEQNLGCALFARSHNGVVLTPEGEKLYAHVKIAVENILAGEEELAYSKGLQRGTVSIAASEVALHCCLLPVLKVYREAYPGVRIRVFNNSSPQAIETLKSGLADLAIVTRPKNLPKALRAHKIAEVQEIPVSGTAFGFLREKSLTLEELAQYPLVGLDSHTATFDFYSDIFLEHGLRFLPDIEAATADQILPMVKSGLGIGFVPESFAQVDILSGSVFPIHLETDIPKRTICLLKQENQVLSIAAKKLERMVLEEAGYENQTV